MSDDADDDARPRLHVVPDLPDDHEGKHREEDRSDDDMPRGQWGPTASYGEDD